MYKYIFFALFSLVVHPLFSQSFSSSQSTTSYAQPSLNLTDAFGRLIPASGAGISGTPYVFDQFGLGKGIFINGVEFEESDLNYSYFDHNLYFTKGNQLYKVNYQLKSFILNGVDKDYNKVSKEFMSLFPSIDNNTTTTFYEMRSNGKVFQLLKYSSKLVKESLQLGNISLIVDKRDIAASCFSIPTFSSIIAPSGPSISDCWPRVISLGIS